VSLAYSFDLEGKAIKKASIVLGAVAPVPLRAKAVETFLEGKPASDKTALAAGDLAVKAVRPLAKNAFKVQIVKGLLRKMLG
jgi:CO/xanthine dehydrogenase FAD-binding subunit